MAAAGRKRAVGRGRGRARSRRCQRGHPRPAAGPGSGGSPREPPGVRLPPALLPALLPVPGGPGGWRQAGCAGCAAPGAASFPCQASSCGTVPRERASAFPLKRALASPDPHAQSFCVSQPVPCSLRSCLCSSAQLPAPRRAPASRSRGCGCPHGWVPGAQPRLLPSCRPLPQVDAGAGVCKGHRNLPGSRPALPEDWGASRGQPRPKEPRPAKKKNSEGTSCRLELRICAATPSKQGVSSALLLHPLFGGP